MTTGNTLPPAELLEPRAERYARCQANPSTSLVRCHSVIVDGEERFFTQTFVLGTGFVWPSDSNVLGPAGYELLWDHIETVGELCPKKAINQLARQIPVSPQSVFFAARTPPHAVDGQQAATILVVRDGTLKLEKLQLEAHGLVPEAEIVFMLKR
jgi:hypothetical protein